MLLQIAPAAVVALLMFAVGMSLSPQAIRDLLANPRLLLLLAGAQIVFVPLLGVGLALLSARPGADEACRLWILLLASCPGGAISNALVLYGRGDIALSVLMTAATSLLAAATMPLVLLALHAAGMVPPPQVPAAMLLGQATGLLLLPCLLGIAVAAVRRGKVDRAIRVAGGAGAALLALSLGLAMAEHREALRTIWAAATLAALLFAGAAGAIGAVLAAALRLDASRRYTVVVEFAVRNVAAAFAISVIGFGRDDFAAFGAVYLVAEVLLLALLAQRRRLAAAPARSRRPTVFV